jgi:ferredoxin
MDVPTVSPHDPGVHERGRVVVDRRACRANGLCAGVAPDVFHLDSENRMHVVVEQLGPAQVAPVRQAVSFCPQVALSLDEGDPCE